MATPDRVRLVVLFGGRSAEHEVSCTTAAHVLATRARDAAATEVALEGTAAAFEWQKSYLVDRWR